jgi:hypothetical protein
VNKRPTLLVFAAAAFTFYAPSAGIGPEDGIVTYEYAGEAWN